jgi:hypothetical protein
MPPGLSHYPLRREMPLVDIMSERDQRPNGAGKTSDAARRAAVDADFCAGDIARPLAGEEGDDIGEFLRPCRSARPGIAAREALAVSSGVLPVRSAAALSSWSTRSVWMRPGSTTLTVTPCAATSCRQRLRPADHRRADAVRQRQARDRLLDAGRGDGDDAAEAALRHARQQALREVEEIGRHRLEMLQPVVAPASRASAGGGPPELPIRMSTPPASLSTPTSASTEAISADRGSRRRCARAPLRAFGDPGIGRGDVAGGRDHRRPLRSRASGRWLRRGRGSRPAPGRACCEGRDPCLLRPGTGGAAAAHRDR